MAAEFIKWMDPPSGGNWLDVGTGTGALVAAICELADPRSVVGCDPSADLVDVARIRMTDSRVTWRIAGAGELPRLADGYDAVVSALALNFFPDPRGAVAEQLELARAEGLVGALVWDYAAGMEFLRHFWDAATSVVPNASEHDEGRRFRICEPTALAHLFRSAGADEVRVAPLSVQTVFADFDDYWRPFLGGTGPAPSFVASLSDDQRTSLQVDLKKRLAVIPGRPIRLAARAWAVRGRSRAP